MLTLEKFENDYAVVRQNALHSYERQTALNPGIPTIGSRI